MIRIEGNINRNRCVRKVLKPNVVPFLQGIPGVILQQDNARSRVEMTVQEICSDQQMHLFLDLLDRRICLFLSDLVGRLLVRVIHLAVSRDELWLRIQAIWNFLIQKDIQNILSPFHVG